MAKSSSPNEVRLFGSWTRAELSHTDARIIWVCVLFGGLPFYGRFEGKPKANHPFRGPTPRQCLWEELLLPVAVDDLEVPLPGASNRLGGLGSRGLGFLLGCGCCFGVLGIP